MHMLTDIKSWERLKDLGIEKWLEDNGATSVEDCYPGYIFEELEYPSCKHRIFKVIER